MQGKQKARQESESAVQPSIAIMEPRNLPFRFRQNVSYFPNSVPREISATKQYVPITTGRHEGITKEGIAKLTNDC